MVVVVFRPNLAEKMRPPSDSPSANPLIFTLALPGKSKKVIGNLRWPFYSSGFRGRAGRPWRAVFVHHSHPLPGPRQAKPRGKERSRVTKTACQGRPALPAQKANK